MDLRELTDIAVKVRGHFDQVNQAQGRRAWTGQQIALGLVTDLGDLVRLLMEVDGFRSRRIGHDEEMRGELADCLWSLLILAESVGVDLESAFQEEMSRITERYAGKRTE
jgi:NTP pyrophosphatase (non-canonical NTP hydrolase)